MILGKVDFSPHAANGPPREFGGRDAGFMWVADHEEMKTLVALESVRHSRFHKKASEKRKKKIQSQKEKKEEKGNIMPI